MKTFYITTPIYYANGSPHLGHFLTTSAADALARYYRQELGEENVFFTTGLDEHGTNVEQSAKKEGYSNIQEYVDRRFNEWKEMFDVSQISYDYFVRTTNPKHKDFVKKFISTLVDNGDVYKAKYKGKYCNGCEKFLTKSDLDERGLCPLHRPDQVVEVEEENYFFKLSKYAPKVAELLQKNTLRILPDNKKKEILSRISQGVEDISISRPKEKISWGIEFPNDSNQVIYVWVEALLNYLSSLHINKKEIFWEGQTTHLLGKDISWFHNVIWPSLLLSAKKPLFKESFVHSFLKVAGQKMSKSLGNVITPQDLISRYGLDGARFLILSSLPYKNDSDVTKDYFDKKYSAVLSNGLGNLISRVTKLCENTDKEYYLSLGGSLKTQEQLKSKIKDLIKDYKLNEITLLLEEQINFLDKEIQTVKPWENLEESQEFLQGVLLHILFLLHTFNFILPQTSKKVFAHFNFTREQDKKSKIKHLTGLFPRLS